MSEENMTPLKVGLKYGGYVALASIALTFFAFFFDDDKIETGTIDLIADIGILVLTFLITFIGVRVYRNHNEGFLTFGEAMGTSIFIALFSGIIIAIFSYIYFTHIDPQWSEIIVDQIDYDEMPSDEAEVARRGAEVIGSPFFLAMMSFMASIIMGLIYGVISGAILRKG